MSKARKVGASTATDVETEFAQILIQVTKKLCIRIGQAYAGLTRGTLHLLTSRKYAGLRKWRPICFSVKMEKTSRITRTPHCRSDEAPP